MKNAKLHIKIQKGFHRRGRKVGLNNESLDWVYPERSRMGSGQVIECSMWNVEV